MIWEACHRGRFFLTHVFCFFDSGKRRSRLCESSIPRRAFTACLCHCSSGMCDSFRHMRHHASGSGCRGNATAAGFQGPRGPLKSDRTLHAKVRKPHSAFFSPESVPSGMVLSIRGRTRENGERGISSDGFAATVRGCRPPYAENSPPDCFPGYRAP